LKPLWEEWGWKIALVIAILAVIVAVILSFYLIISGLIGGLIGFLFCWFNKKRSFIKIAGHWIFIIAIFLTAIFVAIGNLVSPPLHYIAACLIGFVIGYLLSLRKKGQYSSIHFY